MTHNIFAPEPTRPRCPRMQLAPRANGPQTGIAAQDYNQLRAAMTALQTHRVARKLGGMRVKISLDGNDKYGAWREGEHDDLVLAAALACWRATTCRR